MCCVVPRCWTLGEWRLSKCRWYDMIYDMMLMHIRLSARVLPKIERSTGTSVCLSTFTADLEPGKQFWVLTPDPTRMYLAGDRLPPGRWTFWNSRYIPRAFDRRNLKGWWRRPDPNLLSRWLGYLTSRSVTRFRLFLIADVFRKYFMSVSRFWYAVCI